MIVSHRPISISIAAGWQAIQGIVTFVGALYFGAQLFVAAASVPLVGAVGVFLLALVLFVAFARLVLAGALYTLQEWARPFALAAFALGAALNGALFLSPVQSPSMPALVFAASAAVNVAFFLAVLMQPGAFCSPRERPPERQPT